ncbi:hypothetical protein [Desulfogranum mediterraneum]|uniref:hypothetical protein n=1 Tax=Desulfogranum mediterraneum TaxID=160661 RepID=UPI00041441A6|nr:hypothetical protein [Desulfogranum mediterraneum]
MAFGTVVDSFTGKVDGIMDKVGVLLEKTQLPEQIAATDIGALATNPWFLVPFISLVGYMLYKQAFRDLTIMALLLGVWYASGTPYMQSLVVGDELQMDKVLPVLFGGATVLGIIIYLLFGRSS